MTEKTRTSIYDYIGKVKYIPLWACWYTAYEVLKIAKKLGYKELYLVESKTHYWAEIDGVEIDLHYYEISDDSWEIDRSREYVPEYYKVEKKYEFSRLGLSDVKELREDSLSWKLVKIPYLTLDWSKSW